MAAEIQNFDLRVVKQETNKFYHNLINCVSVKNPYANNWFRQKFTQSDTELWDKEDFFITKRKWFKKLPIYKYVWWILTQENEQERVNGMCYDVCIVWWFRYFLYLNKTQDKLRIYKQINVNKWDFENRTFSKISDWNIVNITSYSWKDYFPTNKDAHKKFLLTTYVRWKQIDNGTWVWIIKKIWDTYFSYITKELWEIQWWPWNYVRTDTGLVHIVWKVEQRDTWWENMLALATTWNRVMEITWDQQVKNWIQYKVFSDYWLTFHFVTSDWIIHWHYDDWISMEYSICWETKFDTNFNTIKSRYTINSLSNYNSWSVFLNSMWWLFISWQWYDKFFFSWLNIVQTIWVYNDTVEYMSNILLIGPKKIGYLIFDFNSWNSDIYELVTDWWFYWKYSYWINDDLFLYVRDTNDFYNLQLEYWYWAVKPWIKMTYLSDYINTDMESLDKQINDVYVSIVWNNNMTFITDWWWNTKVLYYDRYYSTWYKRFITWCHIIWFQDWAYIWNWIYSYEWDTDNWNPITQIISSMFWDMTKWATKKMEYVKAAISYNSYLTKDDSIFKAYIIDKWFEYTVSYELTNLQYIENIWKLRYDNNTPNTNDFVLETKPIWIQMTSSIWVNVEKQNDTLSSEFDSYNNLWNFETKISFQNTYSVWKMWILKFPIWLPADILSFELIARWTNKIEFWWYFLWFQYFDNDFVSPENTWHKNI